MTSPNCAFCGVPAKLKCGGCRSVFYCGKEHQKTDWKNGHKNKCKCYEIAECTQIGRYCRANRDIRAGEVILREMPLVVGPKIISAAICLGCHRPVCAQDISVPIATAASTASKSQQRKPKMKIERNYFKCSVCKWPLCSQACEHSIWHKAECELMGEKKFRCSIDYNPNDEMKKESAYCAVLPLRCLLLKKTNPKGFQQFFQLKDHLGERLKMPMYNVLKSNLITFFKTILSLEDFDELTILKTAAILDTNAFEVRLNNSYTKVRAIYLETAMLSHDCVPNSYHIFDDDLQIYVRAAIDIKKGDILSLSYGQPLQSTIQRRIYLQQSKCFDCTCQRCQDPTELDTFIGSLVCPRCKSGKLLSNNPLDEAANWRCESCSMETTATNVQLIQNRLQFEIENLSKHSPYDLEMFLEKYCCRPQQKQQQQPQNQQNGCCNGDTIDTSNTLLHERNTFVLQIKYALTQLYGRVNGFLWHEIGDTDLSRKISLCYELLDVAEILEPGSSIFRGKLLIDLQEALHVQTKRQLKAKIISLAEAKDQFNQQLDVLKEASSIFESDATMKNVLNDRLKDLSLEA